MTLGGVIGVATCRDRLLTRAQQMRRLTSFSSWGDLRVTEEETRGRNERFSARN
jgi:glycerol-3-phosphate dehydrogenase